MEKIPDIVRVKTFEEMPEEWQEIRRRLNEEIPMRTEGLDMERVTNFFVEKGLTVKETIIFTDEDIEKILEICEDSNLLTEEELSENIGLFLADLDVVLMKRNQEKEILNGAIITESDIVHEMAHASSGYRHYTELEDDTFIPRVGFGLVNNDKTGNIESWGGFFEEGFAEMLSGEYKSRFVGEKEREELLDMFGLEKNDSLDSLENSTNYEDEDIPLPVKYAFIEEDESYASAASASAAFGMELLCKKSPELYDTMLSARTKLESLRKIPVLIEKIKPGLYGKLARLLTTEDEGGGDFGEFDKGLKIIIDEVYGGKIQE